MLSHMHKELLLFSQQAVAAVSFSISAFVGGFAANTVAWFDPNDLTTMWQDNRGQAVAVVGQPVGLMIDKSRAGALSRLATWDFSSATGITPGAGAAVTGGKLVFTASSSTTTFTTVPVAGKLYKVTYTISGYSGSGTMTTQFGGVVGTARSANGTFVEYIPVIAALTSLRLVAAASFSGSVDDFLIDEVLTSGYVSASGTARPVLTQAANGSNYLALDGVDDVLTGPTTGQTYGPIVNSNYLVYLAAITGTGNTIFGPHFSSVLYHRITRTTSGRVAANYRNATATYSATTPNNAAPDSVLTVIDSQSSSSLTIDVGYNSAIVTPATTTTAGNLGLCYFVIGSVSNPTSFYGALTCVSEISAADRLGLQRYFGALGGLSF